MAVIPQGQGQRIWHLQKLTRTSKRHWSCWERWAGVIFASDCTLANSGRGCNRVAKLLKRLMVIRRIVPPSQHPRVTLCMPTPVGLTRSRSTFPSSRGTQRCSRPLVDRVSENNSCARSAAGTRRSGNWTRPAHVIGSTRCHHRRKPLMRSLQYERDQPDLSE